MSEKFRERKRAESFPFAIWVGGGRQDSRNNKDSATTALWAAQFLSHLTFLVAAFRAILNQTHFVRLYIQLYILQKSRIPQYMHWFIQTSTFYGERAVGAKGKPFIRLN